MSDAVTATDEGQQEKLFRQAGDIIEKSLEKVRIEFFILEWDHSIITVEEGCVGVLSFNEIANCKDLLN